MFPEMSLDYVERVQIQEMTKFFSGVSPKDPFLGLQNLDHEWFWISLLLGFRCALQRRSLGTIGA